MKRFVMAFLFLLLALAGCREAEAATIRVAVLPILDAFPMYVAEAEGYFAEENVVVEFIPVSSAPERDALIQAGEAEAMINELLSTMFYNADEQNVVTVSYAYKPTADSAHFYLLASAQSGVSSVEELAGREIGISEGTIIEYNTERLLEAEGLAPEEVNLIAVPNLGDRLALLNAGELTAASLPDPLASLALAQGATIVIDDSAYPQYGGSVFTFRREFAEDHSDTVQGFLRALGRAVEVVNDDPDQFSAIVAERQLIPPPLMENFRLPRFPEPAAPPESQWEDVTQWALAKGYLEQRVPYESSVADDYLP